MPQLTNSQPVPSRPNTPVGGLAPNPQPNGYVGAAHPEMQFDGGIPHNFANVQKPAKTQAPLKQSFGNTVKPLNRGPIGLA